MPKGKRKKEDRIVLHLYHAREDRDKFLFIEELLVAYCVDYRIRIPQFDDPVWLMTRDGSIEYDGELYTDFFIYTPVQLKKADYTKDVVPEPFNPEGNIVP
jgi:hypothetical protein